MPQMKPMNWLKIAILLFCYMLLYLAYFYFNMIFIKKSSKLINFNLNKMNLLW